MSRYPREQRRMWGGVLISTVVAALLIGIDTDRYSASATPHAIGVVDPAFDPDWPDVFLILTAKCAGCHRPGTDQVDLTSYEAVISAKYDGQPLVIPGDAEGSILYQQVAWNSDATLNSDLPDEPEMPTDPHEWLTSGQQERLVRWINNGASQYQLPSTCHPSRLTELDFPSAKQCRACHPRQYEEWSRSMHAYAQHSPIFEAFNLTLIERTGGTIGTFCTRCHTPLGTALGENGSRRNVHRSRLSMEGVTCAVCHRPKTSHYKSNSRLHIPAGKLETTCMFGPFENPVGGPELGGHPAGERPYIKTSQFCGECHDVTNPQGIRLEEAFSEWQNSPAAKDRISCQHCHMGPVQGLPIPDNHRPLGYAAELPGDTTGTQLPLRRLTDHTFAGPDYSVLPDTEFPYKLDWMYEVDYRDFDNLSAHQKQTLNELRRKNRRQLEIADAKRYELLRNSAKLNVSVPTSAAVGERIKIRVDVRSTTAGHSVPTGFTAERQVWISTTVRDSRGRVIFASGDLDRNADVRDDHSHEVLKGKVPHDRYLLNFQNKFITLNNKGTERSVVLSVNRNLQPVNVLRPATGISAAFGRPPGFRIAKGSLPPLRTMGQTYPVRLPDCVGLCFVDVKLNFRHIPPVLLDYIGASHLKSQLEIVVIDEFNAVIDVGGGRRSHATARRSGDVIPLPAIEITR